LSNNLFITGKIRTGKSTILKEAITPFKSLAGGFFVQRILRGKETYAFRLVDLAKEAYLPNMQIDDLQNHADYILLKLSNAPVDGEVFKRVGMFSLTNAWEHKGLILMDELGIMEANIPEFTDAVWQTLDKNIPVIGVIKKKPNPFLDKVRARTDVQIIDLDELGTALVRKKIKEFLRVIQNINLDSCNHPVAGKEGY